MWPNRPVRFIVPLAAGGGLDFVARVVGEHLSRELRQQVFIENRTGAGSTIGIDTAIKSAPDGKRIMLAANRNNTPVDVTFTSPQIRIANLTVMFENRTVAGDSKGSRP